MKHFLTAGFAGIAALSAAMAPQDATAQADACTVITTLPATIGTPGNYCLAANHTVNLTTGAAIAINARDVTLDCREFTVTNAAEVNTGSSAGIYALSQPNLLVRNCRIFGGFTDGINVTMPLAGFNTSYYTRIEDNYVAGPYRFGIVAYGSAIEVLRNRVYDVGGQASGPTVGIRVGGATQSSNRFQVVDHNLVAGTWSPNSYAYAIYSDASTGSLFRNNTLTGTTALDQAYRSFSIRVGVGSANTIRDNHILGRGYGNEIGIQVPPNAGSLCFDNRIGVSLQPTVGCDTRYGNY
jgi:hypothetical protein